MNPLLYEPHIDGHLISYYNREGVQFADAVDNDAAHLAKPVWAVPFLMKNISNIYNANYNYYQITTAELRFEIVAAAASGAMGHFGFPGKLMDADYLHAYAEGVTAVARWEDHYTQGERRDATVDVTSDSDNVRHRVHVWRDTTLLTLLNGGDAPAEATVPAAGGTRDIQLPGRGFAQLVLE